MLLLIVSFRRDTAVSIRRWYRKHQLSVRQLKVVLSSVFVSFLYRRDPKPRNHASTWTGTRYRKKKGFYLSVNVFSTKVLIGDTIFTSPTWDGTAILRQWLSEPREGLLVCRVKAVPSFLSYFKTLSIGPAPGIEPATSRSAVKRSTDWANLPRLAPSKINWRVIWSSSSLPTTILNMLGHIQIRYNTCIAPWAT